MATSEQSNDDKKVEKDVENLKGENTGEQSILALEKLRFDRNLVEKQLANYDQTQKQEKTKIKLSFVTSIVAIFGLLGTIIAQQIQFRNQQQQLELIQRQHTDDAISRDISLLASSSVESSQLLALAKLSLYLTPQFAEYHETVIDLMVRYVEANKSKNIRDYIQKEITIKSPSVALEILIKRNRDIYQQLPGESILWMKLDSNQREYYSELIWNAETITMCLLKMKTVENIDFSRTVLGLGRPTVDTTHVNSVDDDIDYGYRNITGGNFNSINFSKVKFDNCLLSGISFSKCFFDSVSFDNANLLAASFEDSKFIRSSFNGMSWLGDALDYLSDEYLCIELFERYYPSFYGCDLNLINFSPDILTGDENKHRLEFFSDSVWDIDSIGSEAKKVYYLTNEGSNLAPPAPQVFDKR